MSYRLRVIGTAGSGEYWSNEYSTNTDDRAIELAKSMIQYNWMHVPWFGYAQVIKDNKRIVANLGIGRTEIKVEKP